MKEKKVSLTTKEIRNRQFILTYGNAEHLPSEAMGDYAKQILYRLMKGESVVIPFWLEIYKKSFRSKI